MKLVESLRIALRALSANKLRSALTMLGMMIGVAAVISLMAIGRGSQEAITQRIAANGTNVLYISPGAQFQGGIRQAAGTQLSLTYEDAEALAAPEAVPQLQGVAPQSTGNRQLIFGDQNSTSRVVGTTPDYQLVQNAKIDSGRFFDAEDTANGDAVVVIGPTIVTDLFGGTNPIGQYMYIGVGARRISFQVIGVLASQGSTGFGNNADDIAIIPITTQFHRLAVTRTANGQQAVNQINVSLKDGTTATREEATARITSILMQRHHVQTADFTIQSQDQLLDTVSQVTGTFTVFLGAVAGISLLVGGIGIMNIMIVSVTERTREIGIRKAVGATQTDILLQFMVEALTVSILGGGIGVAIGVLVSRFISGVPGMFGGAAAVVSADSIILALSVSVAIGLFFGIYPAFTASRLRPIEALRYE